MGEKADGWEKVVAYSEALVVVAAVQKTVSSGDYFVQSDIIPSNPNQT